MGHPALWGLRDVAAVGTVALPLDAASVSALNASRPSSPPGVTGCGSAPPLKFGTLIIATGALLLGLATPCRAAIISG
jgi:hypothetical protein